jgi:hypothetical protein
LSTTPLRQRVCVGLCIVVALLSLDPVANMLSPRQRMNASFEPFGLVNTYGAFGSVGRTRDEVVIEGTNADPADDQAEWKEYEFPCKPTDPLRRPCLITPYHYRLDWQLWFAGFGSPQREPWIVHLVYELLIGEPNIRQLLARDPFPEAPPNYIRISRYRYTFTHWGQAGWYERARLETYLRPLSRDDPQLLDFLAQHGWGPHGLH